MPVVMVHTLKTDDINAKKTLVKELTDVIERNYKVPRQSISVIIKEDLAENVGVGGVLASERWHKGEGGWKPAE